LDQLNKDELETRQMNVLKGGGSPCTCTAHCGCLYYGEQEGPDDSYYGGSSTEDNGDANMKPVTNSNFNSYPASTTKSHQVIHKAVQNALILTALCF
jgi:natural product precursor